MATQLFKTSIDIDGSVSATGAKIALSAGTETNAVMVKSNGTFEKRQLGTAAFADISTTVASNATVQTITTTSSRNYQIQDMDSGKLMVNVPWTNTTYSAYAGSTSPGTAALVPARDSGSTTTKYLREDGDWVVPPDTNTQNTYTKASFDLDHLFTLIGASADTAENMGAYTLSTIADNQTLKNNLIALQQKKENFILACSDETSALTAGTAKVTFRLPYAFRLTGTRASVNTAPTGAAIKIDINANGDSVFLNGLEEGQILSIDINENTSTTAATAAVFAGADGGAVQYQDLQDDSKIEIDLDQIGSTVAGTGLKVTLLGYQL